MSQLDEKSSNSAATGGEGAVQAATNAASRVADVAGERGKGLAGEAVTEIREIGSEVAHQAQNVLGDAVGAARSRAESEVAGGASALRRLADQGQALVDGRPSEAGPLLQYAERGVDRLRRLAGTLETRGADGVVSDVQSFARRRPGAFLAIAGVGGFVVGRMLRSGALSGGSGEPATTGYEVPEEGIASLQSTSVYAAPAEPAIETFDSPGYAIPDPATEVFESPETDFFAAPEATTEPGTTATDLENPWLGSDGEVSPR